MNIIEKHLLTWQLNLIPKFNIVQEKITYKKQIIPISEEDKADN